MNDEVSILLKQKREEHRYSHEQIAEMLNINQSTYARVEQGKASLDIMQLSKLSSLYDVPLKNLLPNNFPFVQNIYDNEIGIGVNNGKLSNDNSLKYLQELSESIKTTNEKLVALLEKLVK